jgi:hypothetical protein
MEKVLLGGWTCAKKEKAEGGVLAHSGGKGKGGGGGPVAQHVEEEGWRWHQPRTSEGMRHGRGRKEIERERLTHGPHLIFKSIQIPVKLDLIQKGPS